MNNLVITISREFGSGGHKIGTMLSEKLGIPYYDKDLIKLASEQSGINENLFGLADEKSKNSIFRKPKVYSGDITSPDSPNFTSEENLFNYQAKVIKELAEQKSPCIIIGRCADFVLKDRERTLRLFIWADKENCIKNTMEVLGFDRKEAEKQIEKINRERSSYYKAHTGREWDNARNYDFCINTSEHGFEKSTQIILDFINVIYQ